MTDSGAYLDYAATAPVDPRVAAAMLDCLDVQAGLGNPAALSHAFGARARSRIATAAEEVAGLVHGAADFVIWTGSATEAINLGVIGAARFRRSRGQHLVTSRIEHSAVLASCAALEREGFEVSYVAPDADGIVSPERVAAALRPDTVLVSLMHANNELGTVQDIAAIGALCRDRELLLHVDAAQSLGKLPLDMRGQSIDLLSLNAHKACGPPGIGALLLNPDTVRRVEPVLFGGGQQRGMRPGTLPVHQIVGFGTTCRILRDEMAAETRRFAALREQLWEGIRDLPGLRLNGHPRRRLCHILNVSVDGVEGESLRYALNDLAVSSGSACTSATAEPSYVLRAIGLSDAAAEASIRFSLGRFTTAREIGFAVTVFRAAVEKLQALAPQPLCAG
ncbi:MAG: aminotransferase class V-fold PLP-dependent enzyme [Gammaproteobacteria bacterium]|jgi:cysteine desulfurase|nr:aminotransferase class V-fold PLP-dependent enzyme [Gammaproteobacteria bacterium]